MARINAVLVPLPLSHNSVCPSVPTSFAVGRTPGRCEPAIVGAAGEEMGGFEKSPFGISSAGFFGAGEGNAGSEDGSTELVAATDGEACDEGDASLGSA